MWVARSKDNSLWLFNSNKPERCPDYNAFYLAYKGEDTHWVCGSSDGIEDYNEMEDVIQLPSSLFPNLKWEDEPIEVSLIENEELKLIKLQSEAWVDSFEHNNEH